MANNPLSSSSRLLAVRDIFGVRLVSGASHLLSAINFSNSLGFSMPSGKRAKAETSAARLSGSTIRQKISKQSALVAIDKLSAIDLAAMFAAPRAR